MLEVGNTGAVAENSAEPRHVLLRDLKGIDMPTNTAAEESLGSGVASKISIFGGGAVLEDDAVGRIVSDEASARAAQEASGEDDIDGSRRRRQRRGAAADGSVLALGTGTVKSQLLHLETNPPPAVTNEECLGDGALPCNKPVKKEACCQVPRTLDCTLCNAWS